jgi:nitric oxide reductase subunit B
VILVLLFGFFVLGFLAFRTYTGQPPIPKKVVGPEGRVLFTRANIMADQGTLLRNGLMGYGSIFGHGAYLGPDYTADYLHRAALISIEFYKSLGSDRARAAIIRLTPDLRDGSTSKANGPARVERVSRRGRSSRNAPV